MTTDPLSLTNVHTPLSDSFTEPQGNAPPTEPSDVMHPP